jgi:oligogalacturonide lyase
VKTDFPDMALTRRALLGASSAALVSGAAGATPLAAGGTSVAWVDPKTGHRITRLTGDDGGSKPYFYRNCFTPQGDLMVFSTGAGIATVDLKTLQRNLVVADPNADLLFASRRTRKAFYSISDPGGGQSTDRPRTFFTVDLDSGRSRQIGRIERGQVGAVNADETLLVGTVAYGDEPLQPGVADPRNRRLGQAEYAANGPDGKPLNFAKAQGRSHAATLGRARADGIVRAGSPHRRTARGSQG